MAKFRKKPVVIEAEQWDGTIQSSAHIRAFCPGATVHSYISIVGGKPFTNVLDGQPMLHIPTLEGEHWASRNDWIIKGIQGEFYPCKPEIFSATYEPADEAVISPDTQPDGVK